MIVGLKIVKASSAGAQHVNTTESAIRITFYCRFLCHFIIIGVGH